MKALRIVYGDEVIVVQCVPRQVVKGRVLIKVYPDCRVVASVPPETPEHEVLSALKTWRWIYQQLVRISGATDTLFPRHYVSGESHYYLGKQYQLKVTEDATVPQRVKMLRGRLEVTVRHKSAEKIKSPAG